MLVFVIVGGARDETCTADPIYVMVDLRRRPILTVVVSPYGQVRGNYRVVGKRRVAAHASGTRQIHHVVDRVGVH